MVSSMTAPKLQAKRFPMETRKPLVSVITWDGSFRESFHTVDYFCNQNLDDGLYEFVWIEYYSSIKKQLLEKINQYSCARSICLGLEGEWHVGKCLNGGIAASEADHLVLIDGDIAVTPAFLTEDLAMHEQYPATAIYYRRWDEMKPDNPDLVREKSLEYLEANCRLGNPTNYGCCLTIDRSLVNRVAGYEEHFLFGGASAVSLELYTRLRNAGIPIMWHPEAKIYHPWHTGTLPSYNTEKIKLQKEIIHKRSIALDTISSNDQVDSYLKEIRPTPVDKKKKKLSVSLFGKKISVDIS